MVKSRVVEAPGLRGGWMMAGNPVTTLSSKHQITLPVAVVRALGLAPGDKLSVRIEDGHVVPHPQPRDWVAHLAGSMPGYYARTREEVEAYPAEVRGDWGTHLEEDSAGRG